MIPLMLIGLVASLIGWSIGKGKPDPLQIGPGTPVVGRTPPRPPHRATAPGKHLALLVQLVQQGQQPNMRLLELAYDEALALGDVQAVAAIEQMAQSQVQPAPPPPEPESPETEPTEEQDEQTEATVSMEPPIPGCAPAEWEAFVSASHTRKPAWTNDRYHGAFEHNKTRLKQLGLSADQLADYASQYQAFCNDISAYHKDNNGLIEEFVGDVIEVKGEKTPVTTSGVLGLLKAAGHMGARSWLTNPSDRERYPQTTEAFVRCNTCF